MFTGIVLETGRVAERGAIPGGVRFVIEAPLIAPECVHGASVAVDGCCLTVISRDGNRLGFDLSPETLARTVADSYRPGTAVNLESSLRVNGTMGGHFVTGHVDTVGTVRALRREGDFAVLAVDLAVEAKGLVAEKGSISFNGVSLTVASWERSPAGGLVEIALIPETLTRTNLGLLAPGSRVNVEYDLIARYLREMMIKD